VDPPFIAYSLCEYWSAIRSARGVLLLSLSFASLGRQERLEGNLFFYISIAAEISINFLFTELARLSAASSMYAFSLYI